MIFFNIFIIFIFFLFSFIIQKYNNHLKNKYGKNYCCKDIMNYKLFSILNIKVCIWNLSHILIYFMFCLLISPKYNLKKHFYIFIVGLLWLLFGPYKSKKN